MPNISTRRGAAVAEQRARDRALALAGRHGDAHQRVIDAFAIMPDLAHVHAALLGEERRVDHVGMLSAMRVGRFLGRAGARQQIVGHLLGHLQRDVLLRLGGRGAEMRRADDVRRAEQRVSVGRLGLEHVERRAGDMADSALRAAPPRRPGRRARS
jgi:hypothetical protein